MAFGSEIAAAFDSAGEREELVRTVVGGVVVATLLFLLIKVFGVKVK